MGLSRPDRPGMVKIEEMSFDINRLPMIAVIDSGRVEDSQMCQENCASALSHLFC